MTDFEKPIDVGPFQISRRNLLLAAAGTAVMGAATLGITYAVNSPRKVIEGIVRKNLPGLKISDADIQQFVSDFIAADTNTSTVEMSGLRVIGPFANIPPFRWMLPGGIKHGIAKFERRVMTEFALGTDMFETYAKDESLVTYVGLYDPYTMTCANPLPRFTGSETPV